MSKANHSDSAEYLAKKAAFAKLTTVYGRQAVREALLNHPDIRVVNLLLASELRPLVAEEFVTLAQSQGITVKRMPQVNLSRITKNRSEDQGVAADLDIQLVKPLGTWLQQQQEGRLLAVVGVTTPGNIGIIARSVAAAGLAGLVVPQEGCPAPNLPLVIKASAGYIFRTQVFSVADWGELLQLAQEANWPLIALDTGGERGSLFEHNSPPRALYLLGNESLGLPAELVKASQEVLTIPLAAGVDSLNVAAAATLVAFAVR